MKGLFIILFISLNGLFCNAEEERGKLLASKNVLNEMLIEGKDVTVEYNIYNVGGTAAHDVELNDDSYNTDDFEVTHGNTHVHWSRIAPGSNVSHVVILKPARSGAVNFTSATINYRPSAESKDKQVNNSNICLHKFRAKFET